MYAVDSTKNHTCGYMYIHCSTVVTTWFLNGLCPMLLRFSQGNKVQAGVPKWLPSRGAGLDLAVLCIYRPNHRGTKSVMRQGAGIIWVWRFDAESARAGREGWGWGVLSFFLFLCFFTSFFFISFSFSIFLVSFLFLVFSLFFSCFVFLYFLSNIMFYVSFFLSFFLFFFLFILFILIFFSFYLFIFYFLNYFYIFIFIFSFWYLLSLNIFIIRDEL
jgi:hypothetical protein